MRRAVFEPLGANLKFDKSVDDRHSADALGSRHTTQRQRHQDWHRIIIEMQLAATSVSLGVERLMPGQKYPSLGRG